MTSNLVTCAHTALAFKIDAHGMTRWHCTNCLRTFNPSGDTKVEQTLVLFRTALERAQSELQVEEVDPDDCREAVLAIIEKALSGEHSAVETSPSPVAWRAFIDSPYEAGPRWYYYSSKPAGVENPEPLYARPAVETTCGHSTAAARGTPGDLEIYCDKCGQVLRAAEKASERCPKCQQTMPGGVALHTDYCPAKGAA